MSRLLGLRTAVQHDDSSTASLPTMRAGCLRSLFSNPSTCSRTRLVQWRTCLSEMCLTTVIQRNLLRLSFFFSIKSEAFFHRFTIFSIILDGNHEIKKQYLLFLRRRFFRPLLSSDATDWHTSDSRHSSRTSTMCVWTMTRNPLWDSNLK